MRRDWCISDEWLMTAASGAQAPANRADIPAAALPASAADGLPQWHRAFELPSGEAAAEYEVHFEGATRPFTVWLNGRKAGACSHAFIPAEIPVTALLQPGENLITVSFDEVDSPEQPTVSAWQSSIDPAHFTRPALLGKVTLRAFPRFRIEQVRVWPDARRKQIDVEVSANAPGRFHIQVEGAPALVELEGEAVRATIQIPEATPWTLSSPHRYAVVVDFAAGNASADRVRVPFGLREFTVKEDQFHLNARPIQARGVWHAPLAAPGVVNPKALIETLKQSRLNALRLLWLDRALLEAADELGLLVFLQLPGVLTKEGARALADAAHHHPSLVAYWAGAGRDVELLLAPLWQEDASRLTLVSAMEPGEGPRFYRPRKTQAEPVQTFTFLAAPPFEAELESYWKRIGAPGRLVIIEALSAFGLEAAPDALPAELEGVCDSPEGLLAASQSLQCEAVRYPIDAFRLNPRVAGYWLRGLTPFGAWPDSSIADATGAPRHALRILEALQRPIRPVIQMEKSTLCVREEVRVNVSLLNDARIEGRGEVFLQVIGPTNQVLWKKRRLLRIPKHGKELWTGSVAASGSTGRHRFVVRLMQDDKVLGDSVFEFHVMEALPEERPRICLVDAREEWARRLRSVASLDSLLAPIHVLPPAGNSVFAYPDNELMQSLAQVNGGAVLLVFSPPRDWNELADRVEGLPRIEVEMLAGAGRLHHPFTRQHPLWEALPARGFLRQPYRETVPAFGLLGESEEAIAGWYSAIPAEQGLPRHTVMDCRYGQGRIVFVCFKIMEHIAEDPLAHRAFLNLARHFGRRSLPPRQPLPVDQRAVEWLRAQRRDRVRRWLVIGEFPNPNMEGFGDVYPPEKEIELDAAYPGWRRVARWKPWYTQASALFTLDLTAALSPPTQPVPRQDFSVAYAYAEFSADKRGMAELRASSPNALKVWINGKQVINRPEHFELEESAPVALAETVLKQGRNSVLIKVAKAPGPMSVRLDMFDHRGEAYPVVWWR